MTGALTAALTVDPAPWARSQVAFIANYRATKHDDRDALLLAPRWSRHMAVRFAVGAVTGTVLSIFFLTEAVFVSIDILGWRRLPPWVHFWPAYR